MFVDQIGTETGIAVVNPATTAATLQISLLDRAGNLIRQTERALPSGNHLALFARELFAEDIYDGFSGAMQIQSVTPVHGLALKLTFNSRGESILTTLPVADMTAPPASGSVVFPQIAIGAGFSTRLLFVNSNTSTMTSGTLAFRQSSGAPMTIPLGGTTGDSFPLQIAPGASRQGYPGNGNRIARIQLLDPVTSQVTTEITVNRGNTVRPRILLVDDANNRRDDFDVTLSSTKVDVAPIDDFGRVVGSSVGFATISFRSGNVLEAVTANVVGTNTSIQGFGTKGLARDPAGRLFLASTADHAIWRLPDLKQTPSIYAGVLNTPGLTNARRDEARFRGPAFVAQDQQEGSLYISDSDNNVIRRAYSGDSGEVVTLAGTGVRGSQNGPAEQASFNNPQGIALDRLGNVWVADTGNHVIRLIDVKNKSVRTVAGVEGVAGLSNGTGAAALFSSPTGIAFEAESLVQQLDRESKGQPPPKVSILVADTGNGVLRRVWLDGVVETLSAGTVSATTLAASGNSSLDVARATGSATSPFNAPVALALDATGNIYVSESGFGAVRIRLRNGNLVAAAERSSFQDPRGIVALENGRMLVAEGGRLQELRYGEPQISSVTPNRVSKIGGERVTVLGGNFSPDTVVSIAGVIISNPQVETTEKLSFVVPPLPSGRQIMTFQNRGGIAQAPMMIDAVAFQDLGPGKITTVAGGSAFAGEGGPALAAPLSVQAVAVDSSGNLYLADTDNHRVRRIDARTGIITSVAGNGNTETVDTEGSLAIAAAVSSPRSLAFDSAGNLFIANSNYSVKKLDAVTGVLTTAVGGGYGYCGETSAAVGACFYTIHGVVVDAKGDLYVSDGQGSRIWRVDVKAGVVTKLAGTGNRDFGGDGGSAALADLDFPFGLAIDNTQNVLYFADTFNRRVRSIDLETLRISTVAGGGVYTPNRGNNGPATNAYLDYPTDVKLDDSGNLLIAEQARIRRVDKLGIITTVAGTDAHGFAGDGGPASDAEISGEDYGIALDAAGNIFVADYGNYRVRRIDVLTKRISTVAGSGAPNEIFDHGPATAAMLREPVGVVKDADGNLYVTDSGNKRIRRVDAITRVITTVAGGGNPPSGIGDGGLATAASLGGPRGRVAFDSRGNMLFADTYNYRIRKVDAMGLISTVVGGDPSFTPTSVVVDSADNLYIGDSLARRIYRFTSSTSELTTFAGGGQPSSGIGDNGPATEATLSEALTLWLDASGNLILVDIFSDGGRVREINTGTGIIRTIAGGGVEDYAEGRPATRIRFLPIDAVTDDAGNLFIVDYEHPLGIRRVPASTGLISTIAGTGEFSADLGDSGPALKAFLYYPSSIFVDRQGNLFIADTANQRIRAVRPPIP